MEAGPSFPSRDRSALIAARNPSAVEGTTINFSLLNLACQAARAGRPQPGLESTGVSNTSNKNGCLVRTLSCQHASVGYVGVESGAIWHITQSPRHVTRDATIG